MGHEARIKICFIGGKQAGIIGLLTTIAKGFEVLGIVACDEVFGSVVNELNLPSFSTAKDKEFLLLVKSSHLLINVHGREILESDTLNLPKLGCINVHPCLYKYKGKNPIERLLKDNNPKASVGVHWMTEEVDEGKVVIEEYVDVLGIESVERVYNKLYPYYCITLSRALDRVMNES